MRSATLFVRGSRPAEADRSRLMSAGIGSAFRQGWCRHRFMGTNSLSGRHAMQDGVMVDEVVVEPAERHDTGFHLPASVPSVMVANAFQGADPAVWRELPGGVLCGTGASRLVRHPTCRLRDPTGTRD